MIPPRPELMSLLQAAREAPDDPLVLRIVADWLEEYGDESDRARAEFLRLWCQNLPMPDACERWWQLRKVHAERWFGSVLDIDPLPGQEGALLQANVEGAQMPLASASIAADPEAWAWVASVHLMLVASDRARVAESPLLGHVSRLALRGEASILPDVIASPRFADVRRLDLSALAFTHALLDQAIRGAGGVEWLSFDGHGLPEEALGMLGSADWPRLRGLGLRRLPKKLSATLPRLLACRGFHALESLDLAGSDLKDAGAVALAAWPALGRLRMLDLSDCGIQGRGARVLASSPYFRSSCKFKVGGNQLGKTARLLTG